jgi:hypothetical protein
MKKPIWLRVAGWLVVVSWLGVVKGGGAELLLLDISLILCCASLLVWLGGTLWWRLKATARPPLEPRGLARRLGAGLRKLALVVFVPFLLLFLSLGFGLSRARRIEKRVTQGMTVAELIRVVDGWTWMSVRSSDPGAESVYVTAGQSDYSWRAGDAASQYLSRDELIDRLQRLGGGTRDCQISYTYKLAGPGKYSFGVTVGRDGKVRSIRPGHAWD